MLQISEALQKNKFLTSLDLSSNRITDGGAEVSGHTLLAHDISIMMKVCVIYKTLFILFGPKLTGIYRPNQLRTA